MPRPTDRSGILARLRKVISDGGIIVGAGAGMFKLVTTMMKLVT